MDWINKQLKIYKDARRFDSHDLSSNFYLLNININILANKKFIHILAAFSVTK